LAFKKEKMSKVGDIIGKIVSGSAGSIVDSVGNVADKFIQTKEEKEEFRQLSEKEINRHIEIMQQQINDADKEISNRWIADMNSDSWMAKNIRPMVLIYLLALLTGFVISDSFHSSFSIKDNWIDLLQILMTTAFAAYFGGRTFEKFKKK